ncbi:hypothetical protein [Evtepia sp.]|uniref:hypothetical protein n=1 Tax=Evtepia sp. TaxID=2773933 RepID=UPI003F147D70
MNPILQLMQQLPQQQSVSANNPMALLQQFSQFKNFIASRGQDPKALVNMLMQSGKMSPQQFQQLQQQAAIFKDLLK